MKSEIVIKRVENLYSNIRFVGSAFVPNASGRVEYLAFYCETHKVTHCTTKHNALKLRHACKICSDELAHNNRVEKAMSNARAEIRKKYNKAFRGRYVVIGSESKGRRIHVKIYCKRHRKTFSVKSEDIRDNMCICDECSRHMYFLKNRNQYISVFNDKHSNISLIKLYLKFTGLKCHKRVVLSCDVCGHTWDANYHSAVRDNTSCGICYFPERVSRLKERKIKKENLIVNSRPEWIPYLKDSDLGCVITYGSNKIIELKCPHCGYEFTNRVNDLSRHLSCRVCGDRNSTPERFVLNVLIQLFENVKSEVTFSWSDRKRYDFYLPDINAIIEVHGKQHYYQTKAFGWASLDSTIKNDIHKEKIARENGVKNYMVIEACNNDYEYLKRNVSEIIKTIADINKVDWKVVYSRCLKGNIVLSSEMLNKGFAVADIATNLKVHKRTVMEYKRKARLAGLINQA